MIPESVKCAEYTTGEIDLLSLISEDAIIELRRYPSHIMLESIWRFLPDWIREEIETLLGGA